MSAGVPSRFSGIRSSAPSSRFGLAVVTFVILVSTSPGAMPLTRIPSSAQASPSVRVSPTAPVFHRTLRQHQHIEPTERRLEIFDRARVADVKLGVIETVEVRSLAWRIIGGGSAGAADMHACALGAERLCDAVADTAGAADHEDLLGAEIQFVHLSIPFFAWFDLSGDRCQPCQSCKSHDSSSE